MNQEIVKAAVWAFIEKNQPKEACSAIARLVSENDRDDISIRISDRYLQEISHADRYSRVNTMSEPTWDDIMRCFKAAYDFSEMVSYERRWLIRKKIINKALEYINKLGAPTSKLVEFLFPLLSDGVLVAQEKKHEAFLKKVVNAYLEVSGLRGQDIFRVSELIPTVSTSEQEAKRLLIIFIKWGDYEAIRAIGNQYAVLEEYIYLIGEDILLSCLQRGRLEDAIKALSLIGNTSKRFDYADLLGAELIDQE